jgi:hypothetical protein
LTSFAMKWKLHFCSIRTVLFYSSGTGFILLERYSIKLHFCSIRTVLFYSSGTGFILFERYRFYSIRTVLNPCTALRVRCRVLQSHLGKNCGAKKCGGRYEKVR